MGYAILRIAPRKTTASAAKMLKHALREEAVPNALEDAPKPSTGAGAGFGYATSKDAMQALQAKIADAKKVRAGWQKSSTAALDILVTASRADMLSWTKQRQDSFFTRALDFIAARFGGKQNVLAATIHRDESTPHMQVILAPVDPSTGRFSASKMVGGRDKLSQLQTDFHAECGEPFDLERGQKRTNAKHVPVRAFYGAMESGLEPPRYVSVPPAPTLRDNLTGSYKAKMAAHEAALATNAEIRKQVHKQAQRGRSVHPQVIKKQADLYRANLANVSTIKAQTDHLARQRTKIDKQAQTVKVETAALEGHRAALDAEVRQAVGSLVGIVDRFSGTIKPEYRATLAQELGIELKGGKLLDQIRRAGLAGTAQEALELLDRVTSGEFSRAAQNQAQRDAPRPGK